jgi:hypothetical protein
LPILAKALGGGSSKSINYKMADAEVSGECSSHISVKSKGLNNVTTCKRCREYEIQLKEALDELISIRMVNELLQKELLSYTTP